jgi:hypothetical protein
MLLSRGTRARERGGKFYIPEGISTKISGQ